MPGAISAPRWVVLAQFLLAWCLLAWLLLSWLLVVLVGMRVPGSVGVPVGPGVPMPVVVLGPLHGVRVRVAVAVVRRETSGDPVVPVTEAVPGVREAGGDGPGQAGVADQRPEEAHALPRTSVRGVVELRLNRGRTGQVRRHHDHLLHAEPAAPRHRTGEVIRLQTFAEAGHLHLHPHTVGADQVGQPVQHAGARGWVEAWAAEMPDASGGTTIDR